MLKFRRFAKDKFNSGWSLRIGHKPPISATVDVRYFSGVFGGERFIRGNIGRHYFDRSLPKILGKA